MGILATLDRQVKNASYNDRDGWFADWLRGGETTDSGVHISESSAMRIATVYKCVQWRAKMFGMLPKKIYERVDIMGRPAQREARNHPLYDLLHTAPNPTITSTAWFGLISADVHLWGNSYAYIERYPASMRIRNLWRILPDAIRIDQDYETGAIWYLVRGVDGAETKFFPDEILHIRGLGFDGIRGYSPIQLQKQTLGWTKATHQFSAKFYRNAFRPSGLLTSPVKLPPESKKAILASLLEQGKEGGLALIEGAMEYKSMSIPQDDAQFIETMQFQDDDICGIMEVKPHKVGIMRNMTNNNVEQQNIEAVTDCIQPFCVSVEQWIDLQLLSGSPSSGRGGGTERSRFFMQCELKGLLRGDTAAQTAHLIAMRDRGIYDGNDCADYLGNPPFEGGDTRVINAAYVPLDMLDKLAEARATVKPPGAPNPTGGPAAPTSDTKAKILTPIFRDAVGRVIARKKDREKEAAKIFRNLILATGDSPEQGTVDSYLDELGQRSLQWAEVNVNDIANDEVQRAIRSFNGGLQ